MIPSKLIRLAVVSALGYGGWWGYSNFKIERDAENNIRIVSKDGTGAGFSVPNIFGGGGGTPTGGAENGAPIGFGNTNTTLASAPAQANNSGTIHIGSFNIQVFGEAKLAKPKVMAVVAEVVRRFDVVAIQEIRSTRDDVIPRFVQMINANSPSRQYDYCIGPRLGHTVSKEQYAFIYNVATIEIDRRSVYTINDPTNRLHRPPLVANFRARGLPPEQAFTFSLVNIHTDPDLTVTELDALGDAFKVVRDYNPAEDDVIVLGDLNVDDRHLGKLGQIPGITWAIAGHPTNTRGTKQYDNLVFHRQNTIEYVGRAGVFDLLREFKLTMEDALEVSDHFPIWAEFSAYEGRQPAGVATRPGDGPR